MKKRSTFVALAFVATVFLLAQCNQNEKKPENAVVSEAKPNFGGFESQEKWGEQIVTSSGCNDCHTPKKMTPQGPVSDSSLWLSGHPEKMPAPDVNRKEMESKGLVVTSTLTSWVGPWGVSFAANLTSDASGVGNWKEENFIRAIREGKAKGLPSARQLLPPMPWESFRHKTDDELKAIFAYLLTTKPIKNNVPAPLPPASAMPGNK